MFLVSSVFSDILFFYPLFLCYLIYIPLSYTSILCLYPVSYLLSLYPLLYYQMEVIDDMEVQNLAKELREKSQAASTSVKANMAQKKPYFPKIKGQKVSRFRCILSPYSVPLSYPYIYKYIYVCVCACNQRTIHQ